MRRIFSLFLIPAVISPVAIPFSTVIKDVKEDKFDLMRSAYKSDLIKNTNIDSVKDLSETQLFSQFDTVKLGGVDTYKYKSIDYTDDLNKSSWPASGHLSNTLKLAVCYEKHKDQPEKEYFKKAALGLTYHWVYSYYKNANWWMNDLSANQTLTSVGLFLYDDLSPKGQAAFRGKTHYGSIYYAREKATHTGGNLFNYVDLTLKDGIATRNEPEIQFAMNRLDQEITDKNPEGFQTDGSFFQHGRAIQTLSYGGTVINIGRILSIANKGGYGISSDKLQIINKWIYLGARSLIHKGNINYFGVSREYSRPGSLPASSKGFKDLEYYLDIDGFPQKDKLEAFIKDVDSNQVINDGEILYFDVAKYASTVIDGVYFSVRGSEPNLTNTECVNHENRLGLNLSYGTNTAILSRGDEYTGISPLMSYDYMPGTTSWQFEHNDEEATTKYIDELKKDMYVFPKDEWLVDLVQNKYRDGLYESHLPQATEDNGYVYVSGDFTPNAQDHGTVAVFGMRSNHHEENEFTVTNILYPDGLISVGSDLKYTGKITGLNGRKLHTTLEQCMMNETSNWSKIDEKKIKRDGVVYESLSDQNLKVSEKTFTKEDHYNWFRNNTTPSYYDQDGENIDVTGKTLTISMESDDESIDNYAYVVRPENHTGVEHVAEIVNTNNKNIHCVHIKSGNLIDELVIVYYGDGELEYKIDDSRSIKDTGTKGVIHVRPLK